MGVQLVTNSRRVLFLHVKMCDTCTSEKIGLFGHSARGVHRIQMQIGFSPYSIFRFPSCLLREETRAAPAGASISSSVRTPVHCCECTSVRSNDAAGQ